MNGTSGANNTATTVAFRPVPFKTQTSRTALPVLEMNRNDIKTASSIKHRSTSEIRERPELSMFTTSVNEGDFPLRQQRFSRDRTRQSSMIRSNSVGSVPSNKKLSLSNNSTTSLKQPILSQIARNPESGYCSGISPKYLDSSYKNKISTGDFEFISDFTSSKQKCSKIGEDIEDISKQKCQDISNTVSATQKVKEVNFMLDATKSNVQAKQNPNRTSLPSILKKTNFERPPPKIVSVSYKDTTVSSQKSSITDDRPWKRHSTGHIPTLSTLQPYPPTLIIKKKETIPINSTEIFNVTLPQTCLLENCKCITKERSTQLLKETLLYHANTDMKTKHEVVVLATCMSQYIKEVFSQLDTTKRGFITDEELSILYEIIGLQKFPLCESHIPTKGPREINHKEFEKKLWHSLAYEQQFRQISIGNRSPNASLLASILESRSSLKKLENITKQLKAINESMKCTLKTDHFDYGENQINKCRFSELADESSSTFKQLYHSSQIENTCLKQAVNDLRWSLQNSDAENIALRVELIKLKRKQEEILKTFVRSDINEKKNIFINSMAKKEYAQLTDYLHDLLCTKLKINTASTYSNQSILNSSIELKHEISAVIDHIFNITSMSNSSSNSISIKQRVKMFDCDLRSNQNNPDKKISSAFSKSMSSKINNRDLINKLFPEQPNVSEACKLSRSSSSLDFSSIENVQPKINSSSLPSSPSLIRGDFIKQQNDTYLSMNKSDNLSAVDSRSLKKLSLASTPISGDTRCMNIFSKLATKMRNDDAASGCRNYNSGKDESEGHYENFEAVDDFLDEDYCTMSPPFVPFEALRTSLSLKHRNAINRSNKNYASFSPRSTGTIKLRASKRIRRMQSELPVSPPPSIDTIPRSSYGPDSSCSKQALLKSSTQGGLENSQAVNNPYTLHKSYTQELLERSQVINTPSTYNKSTTHGAQELNKSVSHGVLEYSQVVKTPQVLNKWHTQGVLENYPLKNAPKSNVCTLKHCNPKNFIIHTPVPNECEPMDDQFTTPAIYRTGDSIDCVFRYNTKQTPKASKSVFHPDVYKRAVQMQKNRMEARRKLRIAQLSFSTENCQLRGSLSNKPSEDFVSKRLSVPVINAKKIHENGSEKLSCSSANILREWYENPARSEWKKGSIPEFSELDCYKDWHLTVKSRLSSLSPKKNSPRQFNRKTSPRKSR